MQPTLAASGGLDRDDAVTVHRVSSQAVSRFECVTPLAEQHITADLVGRGGWSIGQGGLGGKDSAAAKHSEFFKQIHPIFAVCFLSMCSSLVTTFAPPPIGINTGRNGPECAKQDFEPGLFVCICARETVCAKDWASVVFLVLSRASAYFDYPLYVCLFLTKAHNLRYALQSSYLSLFAPLDDVHQLHTLAGTIVSIEVVWHSFFHLLRWGLAGDIDLLWNHVTGITGLICLLLTAVIALPMSVQRLRKCMSFELRKAMHYLSIVWALVLCFHAPKQRIGIVMGLVLTIYLLDYIYGYYFKIHHLHTLIMTRLGANVEIMFENPPGFVNNSSKSAGYVYICLPWISKLQWHTFSVVIHPTLANHSSVCMACVGDWTKAVHKELSVPSSRPGWVYGPFASPFSAATSYDNIIVVALGIGITPALSMIVSLKESRQVNLIWICRDPDLIEYYLHHVPLNTDRAWSLIHYTGKRKLVLDRKLKLNPMLKIFKGRPDLEQLVIDIVNNVSSGVQMPDTFMELAEEMETELWDPIEGALEQLCQVLERFLQTYSMSEFYFIAAYFSQQLESISCDDASAANILQNLKLNAPDAMEQLSVRRHGVSKSGLLSMLGSELCSFPPDRSVNDFLQQRFDALDPDTSDSFLDVGCFEVFINSLTEDYQDLFNCPLANLDRMDILKRSSSHMSSANLDRTGTLRRSSSVLHRTNSEPDIRLQIGLEDSLMTPVLSSVGLQTDRYLPQNIFGENLTSSSLRSVTTSPVLRSAGSLRMRCGREHLPFPDTLHILAKNANMLDQAVLQNWQMFYCGGAAAVETTLKQIKSKYKIGLKVESFDW